MPAYEKCESEGFRLSSCGKILAMVTGEPSPLLTLARNSMTHVKIITIFLPVYSRNK
jgi:hypothetical protein